MPWNWLQKSAFKDLVNFYFTCLNTSDSACGSYIVGNNSILENNNMNLFPIKCAWLIVFVERFWGVIWKGRKSILIAGTVLQILKQQVTI